MTQSFVFSKREKEVIELLLRGKSNKQIALALGISQSTVEYHLKNVYIKLQVSSRTEAVLRLGKSISGDTSTGLGESTVESADESAENGGKPISSRRIPMKNVAYILGSGLLTTVLVVAVILANLPAEGERIMVVTPTNKFLPAAPTIFLSPTQSFTEQSSTDWQQITYTNTLDSSNVKLTLKWFYIDSARVSMEFLVSGFPVPQGYMPVRIIKSVSLHTSDGRSIEPYYDDKSNPNDGGQGNPKFVENLLIFEETFSFPINSGGQVMSQEESYIFDITVGGVPIYDEQANRPNEVLPSTTTFHFEAKPSYVGLLTFSTYKAANIQDKVVTLKGAEINRSLSVITLCVFSPDTQQWIPSAYLLYRGNIYEWSGFGLTNTKGDLSNELCYRLEYRFPFHLADDPQQVIAIWVDKLTRDQPERLPNEVISAASQKLSITGIEFRYVSQDHGSRIEILKKPEELTDIEVLTIIQDALTEKVTDSGVLIFDFK